MKKISISIFIFIGFLSSCTKHPLDTESLGNVNETDLWTEPSLAQLYINDMYIIYNEYDNRPGGFGRDLDCATEIGKGGHQWNGTNQFNNGNITPSDAPFTGNWTFYALIRKANVYLRESVTLKGEEELLATMRGEVLFLRAFYYAELVRLFGGVPLIKEAQEIDDENLMVSRSSYDECVDFIASQCDSAALLLPEIWDGRNQGRATKGAAMALKSRMLLYAASPLNNPANDLGKWQRASDAAKELIDANYYSLYPDYSDLFLIDNNSEVIFDEQFQFPVRLTANQWWVSLEYRNNPQGFSGAWGMTRPTQDFVDMYEMANGKKITDPSSGYNPNKPYEGRDPRFYATVNYHGAEWRGETLDISLNGKNGPGTQDPYGTFFTGYFTRKFLNESYPIGETLDRGNTNWILIRYAEVLLNYAEAQLALGHEDEAKTYLDMVRNRAGMPDVAGDVTGPALLDLLRNERTIELAFEEHHFFDVRRWKTAATVLSKPVHTMNITQTINGSDTTVSYTISVLENRVWRDAFYHLPIPQSEIDINGNVVQNEGY